MPEFRHAELVHDGEKLAVLVTLPGDDTVLGLARLAQLRAETGPSRLDRQIVEEARACPRNTCISIIAADNAGNGHRWSFDPELGANEAQELADRLVYSQLWVYRRLLALGFCMHVRVDMHTPEQAALRLARERLLHGESVHLELGRDEGYRKLDEWLLRNFLYYFALPLDMMLGPFLSKNVGTIERRMESAARQRQLLPADLIGEVGSTAA